MRFFSLLTKRSGCALGCAALLIAAPYVAAMPLSNMNAADASAERASAADIDPGGRIYVELLNMQDQAIDKAAVAVEAAHEQNTHLAFVLSVLVAVMGAVCAWLVVANLTAHWTTPRRKSSRA
jgi:hypothetical protein